MRSAMQEVHLSALCKYISALKRLLRLLTQHAGSLLKNYFQQYFREPYKKYKVWLKVR
jgi:hypothetical protein